MNQSSTPNLDSALKANQPTQPVTANWDLTKSVGIPKAEQGALQETLTDAKSSFDIKNANNSDQFNNLSEFSDTLQGLEQGALNEGLMDAGTAMGTLNTAATNQFSLNNQANNALFNAEQNFNTSQYSNVTDALRGNRLAAGRMGESGSRGVTDRMLTQAEMSAARDYANLGGTANIGLAQRTLENAGRLGAQQTQNAEILAQAQGTNNLAQTELNTGVRTLDLMKQKELNREQIVNELANTIGSTQEQTLPAVTAAENWLDQQILEGKIEELNAEEKRQAIIDSTKTLLQNPSLMDAISAQVDDQAILLGEEFSADEQLTANRIANLKNIPGLEQSILDNMGESMFALYKQTNGEIRGIYEAALSLGLIDGNGYYIPANSYAEDAVGNSTDANLSTINADEAGGKAWLEKGVDYVSDKIGEGLNDVFNTSAQNDDNAVAVK